ncbi:MAG: phage shock protein PspC (stress-responsive transcriptional regulator) [Nonlabens sp.]|jgi:phage shock protein PspC (stress-responsive transcriptional regulator)|uniref:PspC domain-containing protein n=1 Tax=Nonlabens sp. TaxID=1888209 RepID=UPI0039E29849
MNKTININLAGLFFHIDEDAFQRLQRYLAAVRKSFAGTSGADEIMTDIESRIAELFLEKRANEMQVISITHVEEVINIMGQPEDYEVDEEIFEEQTSQRKYRNTGKNKQLFRDTQSGYVGGVAGGIGYYLGIEAVWVRVILVVAVLISWGWVIPLYILLWILVPDAVTTNQRLTMMGKEVNISNIEENFKQGFEPVVDGQTDASHHIVGQKGKRGSIRFFSFLGRLIKGFLKALVKIIGLVVFLAATTALIGLIVSMVTASFVNVDGQPLIHFFDLVVPQQEASWILLTALVITFGIPLLILAILGLKLLVNSLKSIGMPTKIVLIVLWIISVIVLSVSVARIAASQAFDGNVIEVNEFEIDKTKVFNLQLLKDRDLGNQIYVNKNGIKVIDYEGKKAIRINQVHVAIAVSRDSLAHVNLNFKAKGGSFETAKLHAESLVYDYEITDSTFIAPNYIIAPKGSGLLGQEVNVTIYLPEGTKAKLNNIFQQNYYKWIADDVLDLGRNKDNTYLIKNGKAVCMDCHEKDKKESQDNNARDSNDMDTDKILDSTNTTDGKWKYSEEEDEKVTVTKPLTVGGVRVGKITITKTKTIGGVTVTETDMY